MKSEQEKLRELLNDSHNDRNRDRSHWLIIGPFYAIWLLLGLAIISVIVAQLFNVGFPQAALGAAGTAATIFFVIVLTKYLRRNRPTLPRSGVRGRPPILAVVGVMIVLLAFDFVLSSLLTYLKLNIILAHFLIMGSGIILCGATSIFSQRIPTIAIAGAGGLFTAFLVIALLTNGFIGPNGQPSPGRQVILVLFFATLLFGASYALVSQAAESA